jgi:hypothetical protein
VDLTGRSMIGGRPGAASGPIQHGLNPATGELLEPGWYAAGGAEVERGRSARERGVCVIS